MKAKDLRKKSKAELEKLLVSYQEKLQNLYFSLSSGKLKNVKEVRETKKDIARILTIIKQNSESK